VKIVFDQTTSQVLWKLESTSSFERMLIWLPLLQSHCKTLSKLLCCAAHKDTFMDTPQTLQNYIFIPTAFQATL
jgi:hypothetical protein